MTEPTTDPGGAAPDNTKRWIIGGGVAAALVLIVVLVLVLTSGGDDSSVTIPPETSSSSTTTSAPVTTTTGPQPLAAPSVSQFTASPSPVTCNAASVPVTLNWNTRDAVNVTIEVDGAPPADAPFAPDGSHQFSFNCAVKQHNYQLVVNGADGQQVRQQLVVQGTTPPTSPPTSPPTVPPTKPPATTTSTSEGTTTTTQPQVSNVAVALDDQGAPDGPMTLTAQPTTTVDGKVLFTIVNSGTLQHSFAVLKTDTPFDQLPVDPQTKQVSEADKVGKTKQLKPGKTKHLKLDLAAGNYVLVDNLPGHYDAGARAAFVVTVGP